MSVLSDRGLLCPVASLVYTAHLCTGTPPQGARLRMDGAFNQPMLFRYVALIADGAPHFLDRFFAVEENTCCLV